MGKYAKGILATVTAAVVAVSTFVAPDSTAGKAVTVALAALGAVAVYTVPNSKPAPKV